MPEDLHSQCLFHLSKCCITYLSITDQVWVLVTVLVLLAIVVDFAAVVAFAGDWRRL